MKMINITFQKQLYPIEQAVFEQCVLKDFSKILLKNCDFFGHIFRREFHYKVIPQSEFDINILN